jgi:ABC-2 type transport system permease protein
MEVTGRELRSPFYCYLIADPLNTGMPWGHAGVLTALTLLLFGLAVVMFDRRNLRQTG